MQVIVATGITEIIVFQVGKNLEPVGLGDYFGPNLGRHVDEFDFDLVTLPFSSESEIKFRPRTSSVSFTPVNLDESAQPT